MLKSRRPSRKEMLQTKVAVEESPPKRLNAAVEAGLYRRIKVRAAEEGKSISVVTRELWLEYLSK